MSEIKLDLNINSDDMNKINAERQNQHESNDDLDTKFINKASVHEISREFLKIRNDEYVCLIPIGFRSAGKTMFLSSLIRYARRGPKTSFSINIDRDYPFNNGHIAADRLVRDFDSGKLQGRTNQGTLDLFGLHIHPSNSNLPSLKLAMVDIAGEDISKIKTDQNGELTAKINAIFNGLTVHDSNVVFPLITPFIPASTHEEEDSLHFDFLNYLQTTQPDLFRNSKFFIVVSQWDKNKNPQLKVEEFIKKQRPALYNLVKNTSVIWGNYSVGKILESKDEEGNHIAELVDVNNEYPMRFWKRIYQICSGKEIDYKSFWQKLFS
jgi:hypothetical protein